VILSPVSITKNPLTAYGITKWNSEQEIMKLSDEKFNVTALRFSTVFGGSPRLRCDIVFNNLLANAYTKKKIIIKSDGTPWRPILHVRDACNSIIACIKAPEELINKKAYNVGINNGNYTVNELASAVKKIIPDSEIIYTNEHGNDSRTYKVSFKRILSELKDYYRSQFRAGTDPINVKGANSKYEKQIEKV
jgi:nucleoside-diphosphate-sugar epimerase